MSENLSYIMKISTIKMGAAVLCWPIAGPPRSMDFSRTIPGAPAADNPNTKLWISKEFDFKRTSRSCSTRSRYSSAQQSA